MALYIHQLEQWPNFFWKQGELINLLAEVRQLQGKLLGKVEMLGFDLRDEANLETLIQDVLKTSEIEGEILNPEFFDLATDSLISAWLIPKSAATED